MRQTSPSPVVNRPPVPTGVSSRAQGMVAALKGLLDRVPNSRQALPHLAALENDLARHGLVIVKRAPMAALIRAAQDLATLPMGQEAPALQELGTVLLNELDHRARPRGEFLSSFVSEDKLSVSEGSHTDFMAASGMEPPAKG